MKFNNIVNNPILKKGAGIASIVVAGIVAITNAISDQKREEEFDALKKTVEQLQKKS